MTNLDRARERIALHMDRILENFVPGSKITVLVRPPYGPERELLMTDDDLDEVSLAIERAKQRECK